ncbi:MAG: cyclase family protein [Trueperaceae bacterium]
MTGFDAGGRTPRGWIDATRALPDGHPVWPGDAPFAVRPTARIPNGSSVNLMRFEGTTHLGTHVDAPFHVRESGARIESIPLETLIGPGLVIDVAGARGPVAPEELPDGPYPTRVALRTGEPDAWTSFPTEIRPIDPATVRHLAAAGVRLLATDAPSVDPLHDADLPAHHACCEEGVVIVEGLALQAVPAGPCTFVCLPLRLIGTDAAPARVVIAPAGDPVRP